MRQLVDTITYEDAFPAIMLLPNASLSHSAGKVVRDGRAPILRSMIENLDDLVAAEAGRGDAPSNQ